MDLGISRKIFLLIFVFLALSGVSYGGGGSRVTNEMIYEKLLGIERRLVEVERRQAVLEAELREFKESVDKRFEQVDKRISELREDMNKRFGQVDRRFEEMRADVNKRFEEMRSATNARFDQLYTFLWIITGIFATLTAVVIGFALWDKRTTIRRAKEDRRLAEVLRSFGLL